MHLTLLFIILVLVGCYFVYVKPKKDILNKLKNDPSFSHYILIVESNSEFDQQNYEKVMKHLRIFMMYYSTAFDNEHMFDKMKNQHEKVVKYMNRMLFSIPNSMKRYNYMKYAIDNIDEILKSYNRQIAAKYEIQYITT